MAFFECGFAGANKDFIRMCADLDGGWRELSKGWGFDAEDYLEYGESKFRCRLYLIGKTPSSYESRKTFHESYLKEPLKLGSNLVSLHGMKLEVDVPLAQKWTPTNDPNRRPCVHEMEEDIFLSRQRTAQYTTASKYGLCFTARQVCS